MSYSREAHELLQETLEKLLAQKGELAYPAMVGYLMVNVGLEDAKRIAKHVSDKAVA